MKNWGKFNSWHPSDIYCPQSIDDVVDLISRARSNQRKIRAVGSLHSLNNLCETSEIQIATDKLDRVLSLDKQNLTVHVEGGIKIWKLLHVLAKEGITLPNQGYITEQSIAGAIATATHGSGKTGTLSSFVEEITLVDARGHIHKLDPRTSPHLFSAAVVHLGCLGFVYSLKLRCIPLEKLHLAKVKTNIDGILVNLPNLVKNEYFQFALDPYGTTTIEWHYHSSHEEVSNTFRYNLQWLLIKLLAYSTFDIFPTPSFLLPYLVKIYFAVSPLKSCVDYSYKLLSPADEGHYIEEEIAIPLENFEEAINDTRKIIDNFRSQNKCMVSIILVRFANADSFGYLSNALGRQTVYISLITIAKRGYRDLFREIEFALYKYQGKPHWGKIHFLNKERVIQLYGENYTKFVAAKNELDPSGMFSNSYINTIF